MDRTVVALFDDVDTAQRALEELLSNGFDRNDVSVVRTNAKGDYATGSTTDTSAADASGAAAGAGIGAALGGIAGLVIGLGVLAIPGLGPVIAAGPLATTLAGAGIGAAAGGIIGALTDVGIPENEAGYYAEGIRRGGTLLTVRASDDKVTRATQILNRFSPVDINQRATEWRSSGWSEFDSNAKPYESGTGATTASGSYSGTSGSYAGSGAGMSGSYSGAGMGATGSAYSSRFEDFDNDFRSDWQTALRRLLATATSATSPPIATATRRAIATRAATGTTSSLTCVQTGSATIPATRGKTSRTRSRPAGSASRAT